MKKILFVINESEKERILDMHKSASKRHYLSEKSTAFKTLNEQLNPTNGIYTTKNVQSLSSYTRGTPIVIPVATTIYHDYNNKNTSKIVLGNTNVVAYCDRNLFIYKDSVTDLKNDGFMNVIKSVFCNGTKLKTWDQLTNKVVKTKVKTITGGGGTTGVSGTSGTSGANGTTGTSGANGTTATSGTTGTTATSGTTGTTSNLKATEFPEIKVTPPQLQGVVDTTNMASRSDIRQGYRQGKRDVRELERELRQNQNTLQRLANKMTPEQKKQYETKIAQLQIQINQSAR